MKSILFTILLQIKNISILLNPIIPIATNKVLKLMNIYNKNISIDNINNDNLFDHDKEIDQLEVY